MLARKKTHPLLFWVIEWTTNYAVDTRSGAVIRCKKQ